jgi:hypothetical protein
MGPTIRWTWLAAAGQPVTDDLLGWPADMFAFTDTILDRTEAYRFAVSPPPGRSWPPMSTPAWPDLVVATARRWAELAGEGGARPPDLVEAEWQVVHDALDTHLDDVASGQAWRVCEALLTLHAIADEACAAVAAGTSAHEPSGVVFGAQMRELLARTGSIARVDPKQVRVLPKYRTARGGMTTRSIARYASVAPAGVSYNVQRMAPSPREPVRDEMNVLLLPWPLHMSAADFRPVPESVSDRDTEPFGFFSFLPSDSFDVSLVDRLLTSATEHVDRVDMVIAPENSVPHKELAQLEAVLAEHGVPMLVAGLRDRPDPRTGLASNWVHLGVSLDGRWWHQRQDKHHRWSLDRSQVEQYHLATTLDPRVRWWEAIEIQRRSLQVIELDDGQTIASLVCEDLAQIDDAVQLLRAVGPTLVVALLLDGPQLRSRWTGRYASVLADDPGSAVLTLTAYGMAASASRPGQGPSASIALWKDSARGLEEITLDPGAQGVLLRLHGERDIRRAADGRKPQRNAADLRLTDVVQLQAAPTAAQAPKAPPPPEPQLSASDLTVLLSWSEALKLTRDTDPAAVEAVAANARTDAGWRASLNLPQPAGELSKALNALETGQAVA